MLLCAQGSLDQLVHWTVAQVHICTCRADANGEHDCRCRHCLGPGATVPPKPEGVLSWEPDDCGGEARFAPTWSQPRVLLVRLPSIEPPRAVPVHSHSHVPLLIGRLAEAPPSPPPRILPAA